MTNNDELERERFEINWLSRGGKASDLERYPVGHVEPGSGDVGGTYVCDILQGHWQTWKASRESIEIELPEYADAEDKAEMLEMCRQSVHYAGLKVKGES